MASPKVLPKSNLGMAAAYVRRHCEALLSLTRGNLIDRGSRFDAKIPAVIADVIILLAIMLLVGYCQRSGA